jgi:hypothetical protein
MGNGKWMGKSGPDCPICVQMVGEGWSYSQSSWLKIFGLESLAAACGSIFGELIYREPGFFDCRLVE